MLTTSTLLFGLFSLIFIIVITKLSKWLFNYISIVRKVNKIAAIYPMLPFIGNALDLKTGSDFYEQLMQETEKRKDQSMLRLWIGTQPLILITKADVLDFVLGGTSKHIEKSPEYRFMWPWLGTGLLTSTGDKWSFRRKLITPSFHFEILNDFLLVMNDQVDVFIERLVKEDNNSVDMCNYISSLALDIICETAMGKNIQVQHDKNSTYVNAVVNISECLFYRFKYPWYGFDFIFNNSSIGKKHNSYLKTIHQFTKSVIIERWNEYEEQGGSITHRRAFLDTLLECKKRDSSITFDDIQEEVDTFMFEGHDTTAAALSWACFLIGSHPDVQKKLQNEIDAIFGNSERHVNTDDLRELKYLESVIKEALRLYPSVAMYGRTAYEDVQCDRYTIPKGSTIVILAARIQRDEAYFPNPDAFIPERFLSENNRHPFAYIPFSAGKRNCVGQRFALMEMKVVLASLLRKFEITSLQKLNELKPDFELILRSKTGIIVKIKARDKNFN